MKTLTSSLVCLLLSLSLMGCARLVGLPLKIAFLTDAEVSELSVLDLCGGREFFPKTVEKALREKGVFSKLEMEMIMKSKIHLGMSEEALLCSWGLPDDLNVSVRERGDQREYVYHPDRYVYVEGGKVVGWKQ